MAKDGNRARQAALHLIQGVMLEQVQMSDLTGPVGPLGGLTPQEKAAAQRLALSTLRHGGRADAVLHPLMRKHPPEAAKIVMRMAVVEMLQEGAAPHGVVNAAVNLMRADRDTAPMAGLANAVLRRASEFQGWDDLPPQKMPGWLRGRLESRLGRAGVQALEVAHAAGAPLDITPKSGDAAALAERLGGQVTPTGSVRLPATVQVTALDGYEAGDWWVQDAAAALPVKVLNPQAGERVLDICAAPGGKTMQIAASGATVTALDISGPRVKRLTENLTRTGLNADVVVADALTYEAAPFDAILLDAPCSATGTLRRHPDLPFARDGKAIKPLFPLQADMIDRALNLLKPGGRLVFCTCSLLPEEGEDQARAALERHPGLEVVKPDADWVEDAWHSDEGGLRLRPDYWPEIGGMDGFYIVMLRKPA
ncbi:MAG: RsmB/NOP family class I SAM-dependent RNA methyltransferase [Pseudomonadota bacterium]|nr:RsmB/NOP family class I SAM-dependent RNA methyltransferase [Pseudomonadota bacterium]